MEFDHRNFLAPTNLSEQLACSLPCDPFVNKGGYCFESCFKTCPDVCKNLVVYVGSQLAPPILPNPPTPPSTPPPCIPPPTLNDDNYQPTSERKQLIETSMTITICTIGAALLLAIVFSIVRFYRRRRRRNNSSSSRSLPILFDTQQDFIDEDHGPVLDHPIWYMHTVGLPQSVIDSITVCKFRKDEGLIEGTDCSVCLNEFEEDESLRLLPKCSHAFHIPCIDTWLRSLKNCPLCRAPIVYDTASAQVSVPEPVSSGSGSRDSGEVENLEGDGGAESVGSWTNEVGAGEDGNVSVIPIEGRAAESSRKVLRNSIVPVGSCDPRALSDLTDNRRVTEEDIQPMRRSVSMDSMSALRIYRDVANIIPEEGSSNSQSHVKNMNSGNVSKHGSSSSSLAKLMRSSSIGFSLQMGSISMKKPFASGRKLFSSKHGRSLSSILPL